jgi:4-amino-4-deoxy-L-arabinose transferase-like glycosyltransferase
MEQQKTDWIPPLTLFVVTLLSRLPFTSKLLYNLDSVQFAMAVEKYDVALHQPHPPGYFLYVMLAKMLNGFVHDANTSYVMISGIFGSLTVVAIYYLGKEVFNKEVGRWAALLALASPLLWFYSEVALSYIVEAFFSVYVALLCWRILRGEHRLTGWSAVILGISGGIRQNTPVFLFPLWLFSLRNIQPRKIILALTVFTLVSLLWFVPMVVMTGGLDRYYEALRILWVTQNAPGTILESGMEYRIKFVSAVGRFAFYAVGLGLVLMLLHLYSLMRKGLWCSLFMGKGLFFVIWIVPALLFYIFLHIHTGNPGFGLFYAPALLILVPVSVSYVIEEAKRLLPRLNFRPKPVFLGMMSLLLLFNLSLFLFSSIGTSAMEIRNHDVRLNGILDKIQKEFSPTNTIIVSRPYFLYSSWHTAYYLRDFASYLEGHQYPEPEDSLKIFQNKGPFSLVSETTSPKNVDYFVYLIDPDDLEERDFAEAHGLHRIDLDADTFFYYSEYETVKDSRN